MTYNHGNTLEELMPIQKPLIPIDLIKTAFEKLDAQYTNTVLDSKTALAKSVQSSPLRNQLFELALSSTPIGSIDLGHESLSSPAVKGRLRAARQKELARALWDWVPCSDGRLYHPLLSQAILWQQRHRLAYASRSAATAEGRGQRTEYSGRREEIKVITDKLSVHLDYLQSWYWVPQSVMGLLGSGVSVLSALGFDETMPVGRVATAGGEGAQLVLA